MPEVELRTLHMLGTGSPSCNPSFYHTDNYLFTPGKQSCTAIPYDPITLVTTCTGNSGMKVQQLSQRQLSRGWLETLETWPNMLILGWIMTSHYRDSLHSEIWVNTHKQQVLSQHETEEKLLSNRERGRKGSKSKRSEGAKLVKSSTETVQVLLDRQMDRLYKVDECVYPTVSELISIIPPKIMSPMQLPCFVFYLPLTTSWHYKIHSMWVYKKYVNIYICMYI